MSSSCILQGCLSTPPCPQAPTEDGFIQVRVGDEQPPVHMWTALVRVCSSSSIYLGTTLLEDGGEGSSTGIRGVLCHAVRCKLAPFLIVRSESCF